MRRSSTARKSTTLDLATINTEKFDRALPVSRADLDALDANKQALRLFATYAFLWLPVHCAICWLWSQSAGLAVGAVAVVTAGALLVAAAKWLGLEDMLQKLPLIVLLGVILLGIGFFMARPRHAWMGPDSFGIFLIAATVISLLSSLYRPLTAAYQTVTMKLPFRDLLVAAAALAMSLAIAAAAFSIHWFVFASFVAAAVGGYGALVAIEYAAWAQANPRLELKRAMAFAEPKPPASECDPWWDSIEEIATTIFGGACVGFGSLLLAVLVPNIASPSPEFYRLLLRLAGNTGEDARDIYQTVFVFAILMTSFGFVMVSWPLNAQNFTDPVLAFRLVWNALLIFVTYPEPENPLVHRLRLAWLRPTSVRLAITGLVLIAIATTVVQLHEQTAKKVGAERDEIARRPGAARDDLFNHQFGPIANEGSAAAPDKNAETGSRGFVLTAIAVVVVPPLVVYLLNWIVGLAVLPTYFKYFEQPSADLDDDSFSGAANKEAAK